MLCFENVWPNMLIISLSRGIFENMPQKLTLFLTQPFILFKSIQAAWPRLACWCGFYYFGYMLIYNYVNF